MRLKPVPCSITASVGELFRSVWNRGICLPSWLHLTQFWPIDPCREFANSIHYYSRAEYGLALAEIDWIEGRKAVSTRP